VINKQRQKKNKEKCQALLVLFETTDTGYYQHVINKQGKKKERKFSSPSCFS
jgi:hypothetical protein